MRREKAPGRTRVRRARLWRASVRRRAAPRRKTPRNAAIFIGWARASPRARLRRVQAQRLREAAAARGARAQQRHRARGTGYGPRRAGGARRRLRRPGRRRRRARHCTPDAHAACGRSPRPSTGHSNASASAITGTSGAITGTSNVGLHLRRARHARAGAGGAHRRHRRLALSPQAISRPQALGREGAGAAPRRWCCPWGASL